MARFSKHSLKHLRTLHSDLQEVLYEAIKYFDFKVLEGKRGRQRQNDLYESGKSHLTYPKSKHNKEPSEAVDIAPYPIDWNDRERFTLLAGFVLGIGKVKGIELIWGGDWDRDYTVSDNKFDDLPHIELL